jgi:hypothetical protein
LSTAHVVFLGDLARALQATGGADRQNWARIAALLGFSLSAGERQLPNKGKMEAPKQAPVQTVATVTATATIESGTNLTDVGNLIEFDLERSVSPQETIVIEETLPQSTTVTFTSMPPPLFDPIQERGILVEAASTTSAEGEVDLLAAVELFARQLPLQDLPRMKISSVSRGCQVLIDSGVGMQPFASDVQRLLSSINSAIGREHTTVLTFVDCPATGVMDRDFREGHYQPPANGAVVIAISDLYSGGPRGAIREAEPEDWVSVQKAVRAAGTTLLVFTPYPPERWLAGLLQQMAIVYWDTRTKVFDVRYTRRRVPR